MLTVLAENLTGKRANNSETRLAVRPESEEQVVDPAWTPDHQVLVTTKVEEGFATPKGENYTLLLNGKLVHRKKVKHGWLHTYEEQYTFCRS